MFKKVVFLAFFILAAFTMIAAVVPEDYVVPAIAIVLLTGVGIPGFIEVVKLIVSKFPKLEILRSKGAAIIYAFVISIAVSSYYLAQAGWLPPIRLMSCDESNFCTLDPFSAVNQVGFWASTIFSASTILYGVIIGPMLDRLAAPKALLGTVLAYKRD